MSACGDKLAGLAKGAMQACNPAQPLLALNEALTVGGDCTAPATTIVCAKVAGLGGHLEGWPPEDGHSVGDFVSQGGRRRDNRGFATDF